MGSRRGGAVLEAPEEIHVPERDWQEIGPAPAGAHQRAAHGFEADALGGDSSSSEEPYVPQRGSFRFRLRGGVPKSLTGRILAGAAMLLALGVCTLSAAALHRFLLHDPLFLVTTSADIQITGNQHLTRGQALSVFGADLERNIFRVPLAERRADLERLPWVKDATVMRLLPNHLRVSLNERTPVAFVRQGTRIGLVDASGVLLDMPADAAGDPHYSFPVLTGLADNDTATLRAAKMEVYRRFMTELDGGSGRSGEKLSQSVSEVDVANPEDVKAIVTDRGSDILVHFGDENFLERYNAYEQHLPEWKAQYPKLASADMRYERQVVLEMQTGAGVPLNHDAPAPTSAATAATPAPLHATVSKPEAAGKVPVATVAARSTKSASGPAKTALANGAGKTSGNARLFAASTLR